MANCKQHQAALIDYGCGELPPLARTQLELHLTQCPRCAGLHRELGASLGAARRYAPSLSGPQLEGLITRLSPYLDMRREPRWSMRRLVPVFAFVTASLAVLVAVSLTRGPRPVAVQVAPIASIHPVTNPAAIKPVLSMQRSEITPSLRILAGDGYDGTIEQRGSDRTVRMQHGFVALAFAGGDGRHVRVVTPAAGVDVVGTRFYVGIDAESSATTVQVAEGRVRVSASGENWLLEPSDIVRVNRDGTIARLVTNEQIAAYLSDPYLQGLNTKTKRPAPPAGKTTASADTVPAQLDRAEQLSRAGQYQDAADIYRVCAKDNRLAAQPYRTLATFELARLLGFKLNDAAQAEHILSWLSSHAEGEVLRQALLTRCELLRTQDVCGALACLRTLIAERSGEANLIAEAQKLAGRWQAAAGACPNGGGKL